MRVQKQASPNTQFWAQDLEFDWKRIGYEIAGSMRGDASGGELIS
jgi:hypothetical protein